MPARSTTRITKKIVDSLLPGQTIWDCEIRGFGVRRQKNDRCYVLKCSYRGRQKFITIGKHGSPFTLDQARKRALSILSNARNGIDPTDASEHAIRVEDLCDRYLRKYAEVHKKPRSIHTDRRNIANHIVPLLGRLPVRSVTKRDIERFRDDVFNGKTAPANPNDVQKAQRGGLPVRGGHGVANRCVSLLSKIFNLAEEWDLREQRSNPVRGVKHFREKKREVFLSVEEIGRLGQALSEAETAGTENPFAVAALRLLLLTGCRSGEILNLKWQWVDLGRSVIHLPDSKTGQKTIRLPPPAVALLKALPRLNDNPFVIAGSKPGRRLINLQKAWRRLRTQASLEVVRIHDLRHTYASFALNRGYSLAVIGALLGHKSSETTSRYAHLQRDAISQANEDVGRAIQDLLNPSDRSA